jgi:hypothetical protein
MRPVINYHYVQPGTQEFAQLQTFARSFDHEIVPNPKTNTYAHYSGDRLFGYSDHVFVPTVYPAFHPALTRPQDVLQTLADWKAHCQFSGQPCYIGVPLPEMPGRANFPERVMTKLGLAKLNRELYTLA